MFKKLFNILSLRERTLLTVFLWVCIISWAGILLKSLKAKRIEFLKNASQIEYQKEVLTRQSDIDARMHAALERLDPGKAYSGSQLVERIDTIARGAALNFEITSPRTQEGNIFNIHSVRVQVKKAEIGELIEFDNKIKEESPYLGLERVKIVANKTNPRVLNADFEISSFELENKNL